MNITVIGAGKMGLPLACQFAHNGATVIICDIRADLIADINRGTCPIDEPGVADLLAEAVADGRLTATMDVSAAVRKSSVVVVIVPVLLTPERDADLSAIESVSHQIAQGLEPNTMVSYETTMPVGSTRRLIRILESNGLKAGQDFDLVFSPERVKSQFVIKHLTKTPKIVGGLTPSAADRAESFYARYLDSDVINVGTLEAAEMVKLAGMIYRDINIALSNELARYAEDVGVNVHDIIRAANTDGEAALLTPGIGVGGHCTPVYPYFLIRDAELRNVPVRLAEQGRRVNDSQVKHTLNRLEAVLGPLQDRRTLILGLGFRPQVKEHIFSPAFQLRDDLLQRGALVQIHDPLYQDNEIQALGFIAGSLTVSPFPEVIILNTAHTIYKELDFKFLAENGVKAIVDGRTMWSPQKVRDAGLLYIGIGIPDDSTHSPLSQLPIPVARPTLKNEEAEVVAEVIRSGWLLQGPQVSAFEKEFAEYVGAPHACAVSSGTTALHLALLVAGVGPGDEVITVSHSYIATANSIRYCGATPVFVDICPDTFNIDPALVEAAISESAKAILCVHQIGMPCDLMSIYDIAVKHGLPVIEDAACAIGSEIRLGDNWERIGKPHGDIACFSFHPRKVITTGEGGMITTNNSDWDRKFRSLRQHSMSVPGTTRHNASEVVFETYPDVGFNYRMTDIQAAIGREQLKRLPELMEKRRDLASRYGELLAKIPGLGLPVEPDWARSTWQSFCVRLPSGSDQRQVMQSMLDAGVATRRGVMCTHREEAYPADTWSCAGRAESCNCAAGICQRLRNSEEAQDHAIILPLFPQMNHEQQDHVVKALQDALGVIG